MASPLSNDGSADDPQDPKVRDGSGNRDAGSDAGSLEAVLIPERFLPEIPVPAGSVAPLDSRLEAPTEAEQGAITRGQAVALWLQQMDRQDAPSSLEGLVVAAMNTGHCQSRATDYLAGVASLTAPSQLDVLVAGLILDADPSSPERAPLQLDSLVEERVREPEAGLVKGMAQRLEAVPAPRELEARLRGQLESGVDPKPWRSRHWIQVASVGVALAAGILMISRIGQHAPMHDIPVEVASGDILTTANGLSFTVKYVDDDSMSATDRAVLSAMGLPVSGGS